MQHLFQVRIPLDFFESLSGCFKYILGNDNNVYITGVPRFSGRKLFRYNIELDTFDDLGPVPTNYNEGHIRGHACTGFIDADSNENTVIAGGYTAK